MEDVTKLKKELIELRLRVDEHDQAIVGVSMLEDRVDEHHEILVNRGSFVAYNRLSIWIAVTAAVFAFLSIILQLLQFLR